MSDIKKSTVYLVGAGPGDPGLITVKGRHVLRNCDAVVFDSLIGNELVVTLPAGVEKYYVGKKAGRHSMRQPEINELLLELARRGKTVARLKGGDPFVFGRGAEEAKFLKENNIKFEIIPGITSGVAAAAYSGIPCTDRDKSSFVLLATGHKAAQKEFSTVPWDWVAKATQGTVVIYMGVRELDNIVEQLLKGGMPGDMPAAVIERGTFPSQRMIASPLKQLPETAKRENVKPPAIIVVGKVVDLHPWLQWFEKKPLFGIRVMVTRAADQAHGMYSSLRRIGAEVLPYPTTATAEHHDGDGWDAFEKTGKGKKWLVFTTSNSVRYFFQQLMERFGDIRVLGGFRIASMGSGTTKALKRFNLQPDFVSLKITEEKFGRQLGKAEDLQGAAVVRVRSLGSGKSLEAALEKAGGQVIPLNVYRSFSPAWPEGLKDELFDRPPHAILFTSMSTAEGLAANLEAGEMKKLAAGAAIASIGPATTKKLESLGLHVTIEAQKPTLRGLLDALAGHCQKNPPR